jgi:hypothetical protein
MNAFVAGNVDEVRTLATNLLKAADVVAEDLEGGSETEIKYQDGKMIISYPMGKE